MWSEPGADEIWAQVLQKHGYRVTAEEVVRRTGSPGPEINRGDLHRAVAGTMEAFSGSFPATKEEQQGYFRRFDSAVLEQLGIPPEEGLLDALQRAFDVGIATHVYDDVELTLRSLKDEGFRLGVISNASHELPERLHQLQLARHFDTITYSWEVGVEKPSPRIFRTALKRLGVEASRAVHVGDSYEADVLGARGVGITPMLIDRDGTGTAADCIVLRSLLQVSEYL